MRDRARARSTNGTVHVDMLKGQLRRGQRGDSALFDWTHEFEHGDGWQVERDFVSAIRRATPVRRTDFASGLKYMLFTDAVWQAMRSGALVDIEQA